MHFEVGRASSGINYRAQHSAEKAYLGRSTPSRGRQRVIVDYEVARLAQFQLASIGQDDDGIAAGTGGDAVSDIDSGSIAGRRGVATSLYDDATGCGRDATCYG